MKHTKGNWNLKITDGLIKVRTKTRAICGTFKLREKAVTDAFLGELPPHDEAKAYNDESLANAKLIAAAPDLLKSAMELEALLTINLGNDKLNKLRDTMITQMPELKSVLLKTQTAIKKATE